MISGFGVIFQAELLTDADITARRWLVRAGSAEWYVYHVCSLNLSEVMKARIDLHFCLKIEGLWVNQFSCV